MKKVAVITTGGTIGSILNTDSVAVDMSSRRIVREIDVAKNKLGCSVVLDSPVNKNSEDFAPEDWGLILQSILKACESDVDGIVVTHGTDTLIYSVAAALAYANLWSKKICFTGAYYAPDHPASDTSLSLLSAIEFSLSPHPSSGVFVAFRSNAYNSEAHILNGAALKPMPFDEVFFRAAYDHVVSEFSPKNGLSNDISLSSISIPYLGAKQLPSVDAIAEARKRVAYIHLYPGIDRQFLEAAVAQRDVLVVDMYHSGTGAAGSNSELIAFLQEQSGSVEVLMGAFPKENINLPYESTASIKSAGAKVYGDLQGYYLYTFSVLGLASGIDVSTLLERLHTFEV